MITCKCSSNLPNFEELLISSERIEEQLDLILPFLPLILRFILQCPLTIYDQLMLKLWMKISKVRRRREIHLLNRHSPSAMRCSWWVWSELLEEIWREDRRWRRQMKGEGADLDLRLRCSIFLQYWLVDWLVFQLLIPQALLDSFKSIYK